MCGKISLSHSLGCINQVIYSTIQGDSGGSDKAGSGDFYFVLQLERKLLTF